MTENDLKLTLQGDPSHFDILGRAISSNDSLADLIGPTAASKSLGQIGNFQASQLGQPTTLNRYMPMPSQPPPQIQSQPQTQTGPPMRGSLLGRIPKAIEGGLSTAWHDTAPVLGKIGNVAGNVLLGPERMAQISGTRQFNEREEERQAELQKERGASELVGQQAQLEGQKVTEEPERFRTAQEDVESQAKQREALGEAAKTRAQSAVDKNAAILAQHGMKVDAESGQIIPMGENELPPEIRIREENLKQLGEYRQAQTDLAEARTEVEKAKNDPNSPTYKLALQKANTAQANVARAQAQLMNAYANTLGTTPSGEALPGAPQDLAGNPVGLSVYRETGPTGQQKTRGQMARDVLETIPTVEKTLKEADKAGYLGPAAGRWQDVLQKVGENSELGSRLMAHLTLLSHATAVMHFGGRATGEQLHAELQNLLNQKATLQSTEGTIHAVQDWAKTYAKAGGRSITQPPLEGEENDKTTSDTKKDDFGFVPKR